MNNVVYYIGVPGDQYVKIGTTKSLRSRLRALSTARYDGDKLAVLAAENGSYEVERRRHEQFADSRANGEWFKLTPELQAHIDAVALRSSPEFAAGYEAAMTDLGEAPPIECGDCGGETGPFVNVRDIAEYDDWVCRACYHCDASVAGWQHGNNTGNDEGYWRAIDRVIRELEEMGGHIKGFDLTASFIDRRIDSLREKWNGGARERNDNNNSLGKALRLPVPSPQMGGNTI